jgi:putative hemolysin
MPVFEIFVIVLMVLVNAIFAGYEIALASITVARLQTLVNEKRRGAKSALVMKEGIERSLATVQLGITLVGLAAGATGGASAYEDIAPWLQQFGLRESIAEFVAILLIVVPLTGLTIVIGELMPKLFALRHKEWVCLNVSPLMWFFSLTVWPIVWLLETSASSLMEFLERHWFKGRRGNAKIESTELQELKAIASMARASRLIGAREENIILGAAKIAVRSVEEIMLAAEDIRALNLDDTLSQSLIAAHMDLHTRFPVAQEPGDPQSIVGYITFKDLVSAVKLSPTEPSIRGILRQILRLSSSLRISAALEAMLKERTHIALLVDEASKIVGMITLEDIVEELVGDIQDEHDMLPIHIIRSGSGWLVGGGASLQRIVDLTRIDLPGERNQTLSAWLIERIGDHPSGSEIIREQGHRLIVRKVRRKRVLEAGLSS